MIEKGCNIYKILRAWSSEISLRDFTEDRRRLERLKKLKKFRETPTSEIVNQLMAVIER